MRWTRATGTGRTGLGRGFFDKFDRFGPSGGGGGGLWSTHDKVRDGSRGRGKQKVPGWCSSGPAFLQVATVLDRLLFGVS